VLRPRRATPRVAGSSRDSVAGCRTPLSRDCGPFQSSSPLGRSRSSPLGRPSRSGVLMQRVLGYDALRSVSHTFRRHRLRIGIGPRQHSLAAGGGMGRAVLATVATERTDGLLSDGESTCSHSRLAFTLPTWSASRSPPCARRCRQQTGRKPAEPVEVPQVRARVRPLRASATQAIIGVPADRDRYHNRVRRQPAQGRDGSRLPPVAHCDGEPGANRDFRSTSRARARGSWAQTAAFAREQASAPSSVPLVQRTSGGRLAQGWILTLSRDCGTLSAGGVLTPDRTGNGRSDRVAFRQTGWRGHYDGPCHER
jgi:hypothetical protein